MRGGGNEARRHWSTFPIHSLLRWGSWLQLSKSSLAVFTSDLHMAMMTAPENMWGKTLPAGL